MYTLNDLYYDMDRVDSYVEMAIVEFNSVIDNFNCFNESTEYVVSEAEETMGEKIKKGFLKIIESIKKFFSGIIDKITSKGSSDKYDYEQVARKILSAHPEIGKIKISYADVNRINSCNVRRMDICKKLKTKAMIGLLSEKEFNSQKEHCDALYNEMKTAKNVETSLKKAVEYLDSTKKVVKSLKMLENDSIDIVNSLKAKGRSPLSIKVAELTATVYSQNAQVYFSTTIGAWKLIYTTAKGAVKGTGNISAEDMELMDRMNRDKEISDLRRQNDKLIRSIEERRRQDMLNRRNMQIHQQMQQQQAMDMHNQAHQQAMDSAMQAHQQAMAMHQQAFNTMGMGMMM